MNTDQKIIAEWRTVRTDAISEMFENPDDCGIYPTTQFFNTLDAFLLSALKKVRKELMDSVPLIPADSNPFRKPTKINGKIIDVGAMNGWDVAYVAQMDLNKEWVLNNQS